MIIFWAVLLAAAVSFIPRIFLFTQIMFGILILLCKFFDDENSSLLCLCLPGLWLFEVILNEVGVFPAMKKSRQLVSGHGWRLHL